MVKDGLINNRHPMPVQNYIFEKEIENVFDFESIKNEIKEFIYDRDTDEYVPQVIFSKNRWRI